MRALMILIALTSPAVAVAGPFVTMDRQDGESVIGFEGSYLAPPGGGDGSLLRFDLHGQSVSARGFGGYFTLPFATESGTNGTTAVGDVELGGIFIPRLSQPNFKLVLHAGLTLPTGSTGVGGDVNLVASFARLADFYLVVPRGTSVRFGGSPIIRSGNVYFRGDFGIDVNLSDSGGDAAESVIHVDGGLGVDLHTATLALEVDNTFLSGAGNAWIDTIALTGRLNTGTAVPYVAVILPLDRDAKTAIDYALTFGLDIRLR